MSESEKDPLSCASWGKFYFNETIRRDYIYLDANGPVGKNKTLDLKSSATSNSRSVCKLFPVSQDATCAFRSTESSQLHTKEGAAQFWCVSIPLFPCDPAVCRFTQRSSSCSAEYCRRDLPTSSWVRPPARRRK